VTLAVDHELRSNILLRGHVEFDRSLLPQGSGQATMYNAGTGITWLMNRRVRLVVSYDFSARASGATSYTEHIALVRIAFGL
jgi:hypothetical protein